MPETDNSYYNIMYATTGEIGKPRPSLNLKMDKPLLKKRESQNRLPKIQFNIKENVTDGCDSESLISKIRSPKYPLSPIINNPLSF